VSDADLERHANEATLERREQAVAATERTLDARWVGWEHRLSVLRELREYVTDREVTLRARARRLGLTQGDVDAVLPQEEAGDPGVSVDTTELALGAERAALREARAKLCEQREAAVANRQGMLDELEQAHTALEEQLIGREAVLATAFRKLVERAGEIAMTAAATDGQGPIHSEIAPVDTENDPENRRRFRRIRLNARVDFGTPHNFFGGESENLSIGGVFIATGNLLRLGRHVQVRLTLPGAGSFDLRGVVAWRRLVADDTGPTGLGIRFSELSERARAAIDEFVRRQES